VLFAAGISVPCSFGNWRYYSILIMGAEHSKKHSVNSAAGVSGSLPNGMFSFHRYFLVFVVLLCFVAHKLFQVYKAFKHKLKVCPDIVHFWKANIWVGFKIVNF